MKSFIILLPLMLISLSSGYAQQHDEYDLFAEQLLQSVIDREDTQVLQDKIYQLSVDELAAGLDTDDKRFAFWVNLYNAYIQIILRSDPELYQDRRSFFKLKQVPVAGMQLSFADIEHGIIRHSQLEYFLGYITDPFVPDYEEKLRVKDRDYRIHFALNCGAKDCPPVAVYSADLLDYQFDYTSRQYLQSYSKVDIEKKEVYTAQLFAWFRGDFGGSEGIRDILQKYDVIPQTHRYTMLQRPYDWTLELNNFVVIPDPR